MDCSSNSVGKVISRGIPIIKTILSKIWFGYYNKSPLGYQYSERIYKSLSWQTKQKLRYYKRFLTNNSYVLEGISIKVKKEMVK